jgi:hypothetical protein
VAGPGVSNEPERTLHLLPTVRRERGCQEDRCRWLIHVLDARGHFDPGVHAFFVHGEIRGRKCRICECPDGDDDAVFTFVIDVVHRGTACGAEMERALASAVTNPNECV